MELHIEGDMVVIKNLNETSLADLHIILDAYAKVRSRCGRTFALYDGRQGRGMSSAARKELLAHTEDPNRTANASAVFGAPFAMRILVNMLDRALVGLRKRSLGIVMFETESEARAYLDEQRQRLLRTKNSPTSQTAQV